MRLPTFVTASALSGLLNWAPSIRRTVMEAARSSGIQSWAVHPADVDYYGYVERLLEGPLGGRKLDTLVAIADPDKKRSLTKAVRRMVARDLGLTTMNDNAARYLRRLLDEGYLETAAWLAFDRLSCTERSVSHPILLRGVVELIEGHDGLRAALGDYWSDWCTDCDTMPDVLQVGGDALEQAWRQSVAALVDRADRAQPFDPLLVQDIRDRADAIQAVVDRWTERHVEASEHARQREAMIVRLRGVLDRLPMGLEWTSSIVQAIDGGAWDQAGPGALASDLLWLETACDGLVAADALVAKAKDQDERDDNEASWAEYKSAREARGDERVRRQAETAALLARLGFDKDVDEAHSAAAKPGEAFVGESDNLVMSPVPAYAPDSDLEVDGDDSQPDDSSDDDGARYDVSDPTDTAPLAPIVDPAFHDADEVGAQALADGRYGLAAYVASAAQALGGRGAAGAGGAVLRALCVGDALNDQRLAAVEVAYRGLSLGILEEIESAPPHSKALALLVLAGALGPALFSFNAGASEVLRKIDVGRLGPGLHSLVEFIVIQLPRRGGVLDLATLGPVMDEPALRAAAAAARQQVLDMADAAPSRKAVFARASYIWQEVFKHDPVHGAVNALRHNTPDAATRVEEAAIWLTQDIPARAALLDRNVRNRREEALEGRALEWLHASLGDLGKRLRSWLSAHRSASMLRTTHQAETRATLLKLVAAAIADIAALPQDPSLEPACIACRRSLEGVVALLNGRAPVEPWSLPDLDMLLHADLLLIAPYPAAVRRNAWDPSIATTFLLTAKTLIAVPPDWPGAFESLLAQARFLQAEQAAGCIATDGRADSKALARLRDAEVKYLHDTVRRVGRLRTQADDLLGADVDGKIDPAIAVRLDTLTAVLQGMSAGHDAKSERLDVTTLQQELLGLDQELQCGAAMLLVPLEQEIARREAAGADVALFRDLAAKLDLTSLRDSLAGSQGGDGWENSGEDANRQLQAFGETFACRSFASRPAADRSVARAIETIRHRRSVPLFDAAALSDADCDQAIKLLQAWQGLMGAKAADEALRGLLQELRLAGFKIERQGHQSRAARSYGIGLDYTSDRRDCPVPAFGSAALGKLNILVVELQGLNGTELHGLALRTFQNASVVPVLVIVKGVLPAEHRVLFMKEARRHTSQMSCALLDEASILFLAMRPGRTRGDMFAVALPAGGVQPYSNTSSKSSPEMFFGRSEELAKLWDQGGSCLVYGGRQLGKTALLQQVKVRHHRPPYQVVPYGSLDGQIDLWSLTGALLKEAGVPCERMTRDGVSAAIRAWLDADSDRRLMILIDEADFFLEAEMKEGYQSLIVVRDLMAATNRRCKFVFAGLHNVQRLARTPNSPLHHLGTPLGIGPLFGKDLADARSMVVIPMAAAGIVFSEPSLPNRILSAVGFYPSLLQTFGDTLLTRIGRTIDHRLKGDPLLPIPVTAQDVEDALEDSSFKRDISEKFNMTLDLDQRYRLITLAILHRMLDRREQGDLAPLTDVKIQELSRSWWPQGFAEEASLSAFQGLLQEMVGLGVLVQSGDRFAIRSSRIAAMLGGKEQIDQQLIELSGNQPADKLDTGSLRRLDAISRVPAPLTYRQESLLVEWDRHSPPLYLVLGSKALGIDELPASISDLRTDDLGVHIKRYDSKPSLEVALDEVVKSCRPGRRNLGVLSGPWLGRDMIDMALAVAAIRKSPRGLRIILAPLTVDWDAANEEQRGKLWGAEILTLSPLGRTGLRQWLRAKDVPETAEAMNQLRQWTGGLVQVFPKMPANVTRAWFGPRPSDGLAPPRFSVSRSDLGLDDERLFAAAKAIVDYEAETESDALGVIEAASPALVLRHLERLGIVERLQTEAEALTINPMLKHLVEPVG